MRNLFTCIRPCLIVRDIVMFHKNIPFNRFVTQNYFSIPFGSKLIPISMLWLAKKKTQINFQLILEYPCEKCVFVKIATVARMTPVCFCNGWKIESMIKVLKGTNVESRDALALLCSSCLASSPAVSPRCSASSRAKTARHQLPDFRSCSVCSVSCCCRFYWHHRPEKEFNKSAFTTSIRMRVYKIRIHFRAKFTDAVKQSFSHDDRK